MSKSFFDVILFLTKFDTGIVYTYVYYKLVWNNGGSDDSRCGIKKTMDFAGSNGFFAGKSVAVLNESVCDCLYMCVGCLSGEPDACVVFCSGGCTY